MPLIVKTAILFFMAFSLSACGYKADLEQPERKPSKTVKAAADTTLATENPQQAVPDENFFDE